MYYHNIVKIKNYFYNIILMNNIDDILMNNIDNNLISYINEFYKIYKDFDILFYKKILNIRFCTFNNEIDYYINYHKNNEIHLSCFEEFNKFYKIDYNFLKKFYNDFSNKKDYFIFNQLVKYIDIIDIINEINIKSKYILSKNYFYLIYKDFDIFFYKDLLKNIDIYFETEKEYMYYLHYNDNYKIYSKDSFYEYYKDFDENIAICDPSFINKSDFNMYIFHKFMYNYDKSNDNKIIYSVHTFYDTYPNFNKDIYINLNNFDKIFDNESSIIIHFLNYGLNKL